MADSPTSETKAACVWDDSWKWPPACAGERLHNHESKSYCILHLPREDKGAEFEKALRLKLENKDFQFHHVWFPDLAYFYGHDFSEGVSFSGATFTGKGNFEKATFGKGANFYSATFGAQADFQSATFSAGAVFSKATFEAEADFSKTTFGGPANFDDVHFEAGADFSDANFSKLAPASFNQVGFGTKSQEADASFSDFSDATFGADVEFIQATFHGMGYFSGATFSAGTNFEFSSFEMDAHFMSAVFEQDASFDNTAFNAEAYFTAVKFHEGVCFIGAQGFDNVFTKESTLHLREARMAKPGHVSFDTLKLRPHWFVNVDARCFHFINITWDWRSTTEELAELAKWTWATGSSPYRILSVACQRLANNAENANQYEDASRFRYLALDALRLETWRGFAVWKISWWYWLASGYGERMLRALLVLLVILFLFAVLYQQVGFVRWEPRLVSEPDAVAAKRDEVGKPLEFGRALAYSAGVMMLQKPEPRPSTPAAQGLVILETILGPVQAALLALAIRRKFMR